MATPLSKRATGCWSARHGVLLVKLRRVRSRLPCWEKPRRAAPERHRCVRGLLMLESGLSVAESSPKTELSLNHGGPIWHTSKAHLAPMGLLSLFWARSLNGGNLRVSSWCVPKRPLSKPIRPLAVRAHKCPATCPHLVPCARHRAQCMSQGLYKRAKTRLHPQPRNALIWPHCRLDMGDVPEAQKRAANQETMRRKPGVDEAIYLRVSPSLSLSRSLPPFATHNPCMEARHAGHR